VETFTFLFTDIEGSTAALRRLGDGLYAQVLADHHALVRAGLGAHGGTEVDTQGDAFFAVFSSPRSCLAAALGIQQALAAHAWPGGEQVRVRMGIHTGEATRTGTGLVGLDVHRAARLAAVGHGGQVLFSEPAAALVRDSLPPGAALADLGVHRLKDLGRPEHIFQLTAAGLRAEFPPLRSLGNPALANNLPAQLATFIGRGTELLEVRSLAESSRLVTLTGAGGSGKTRLALQLAAELLDGTGDGVWLVELAAVTDPQDVPSAISDALGMAGPPGKPVLETLVDALVPQNILIVLDNCEHLISACAKAADAITRRCPRVHLLVTSREPLGIGGETIYRVPPLSLPGPDSTAPESSDAVVLFVDRAKAQGAGLAVDAETIPLIVSICRRLDGLPLAIELAAARLRSLSLAGLHDRLDQRFRLLTGGSRTALARQQTLRATVEWSYSLLNAPEQALLGCLSAFADGFDLDAAEAVAGAGDIEVFDVADLLGSLVDKSLVVAEPAGGALRYRLLETIRQFAAERLAEAGPDQAAAVAAAHSRHFLSVAETAAPHLTGPDQAGWLARLDTEHANLRRAAEHAASDPDGTAQVLRFAAAMTRYWMARARSAEALALLLPVLTRTEARQDPELFGTALVTAAREAFGVDLATARPLGEQALGLARQLDSGRLLIDSLSTLSAIYYFAGEAERGLPLGREAVERARTLGDDVILGQAMTGYLMCSGVIDPARTETLYAEAIAATRRSGDQLCAGILHNNASVTALQRGDLSAARAHLEQAAQAGQAIGQRDDTLLINLGWVLRLDGDPDGARSRFAAAMASGRRNGDHGSSAYAALGLACLAADAGEWSRAAVLHGVAQAVLDRTGESWQDPEAGYRQESLDQAQANLGHEQTGDAYARGLALSFEDALDLVAGRLFPFDGGGGFAGDVEDDAIDLGDLVGDPGGDPGQHVVGEPGPVGGHGVFAGDRAEHDGVAVAAAIALDADRADVGEQDHGALPDQGVEAGRGHLLPHDRVGLAQDGQAFRGDLADDPDGQARAGERLAADDRLRQAKLLPHPAYLVLEQGPERLDQAELQVIRQPADVVVRLDVGRAGAAAGLHHVRVQRALDQELARLAVLAGLGGDLPRGALERADELAADDLALLFRVGYPGQRRAERLGLVRHHEPDPGRGHEILLHLARLTLAQQAVIDEHAGQAITNGALDERGGDRGIHPAGQTADGVAAADLLADALDLLLNDVQHGPGRTAAGQLEEPAEHAGAVLGVHDLGVELDAEQAAGRVLDRRHRRGRGPRGDREARRGRRAGIPVGHPHALLGGRACEQRPPFEETHFGRTVFGGAGAFDGAA
jgi:predicted ATPase/class 3 adenylate cyclase